MKKQEAMFFALFCVGMALIGWSANGWEGLTFNLGISIVGWIIGRTLM